MNYNIYLYSLYLIIIIYLIAVVGQALYWNGFHFLLEIYKGNKESADNVNRFLLIGYYLLTIGYSVYVLKVNYQIETNYEFIERITEKVGGILLGLGSLHLFNLWILNVTRKEITKI